MLAGYSLRAESMTQWRLPDRLNEISGLALDADGRLFAVADEAAIVYELDADAGRIRRTFTFGAPALRGDFEGIAAVDGRVYLLTSDGHLVSGKVGEDGEDLEYTEVDTGVGDECELEGLARQPGRDVLLMACKQLHRGHRLRDLSVFAWSLEQHALLPAATVVVPVSDVLRRLRTDRLNPSGLAVDPASGHLVLLASRQHALVELTAAGRLVGVAALPAARHRQPEGIEFTADGRLLIADEGGSHKARLGIYVRDRAAGGAEE